MDKDVLFESEIHSTNPRRLLMTEDMEILGWFFHLEAITKGTNWPISPRGLVDGKRALDKAIGSKGSADAVMAAYKEFAGAVGPTVMTMMLNRA